MSIHMRLICVWFLCFALLFCCLLPTLWRGVTAWIAIGSSMLSCFLRGQADLDTDRPSCTKYICISCISMFGPVQTKAVWIVWVHINSSQSMWHCLKSKPRFCYWSVVEYLTGRKRSAALIPALRTKSLNTCSRSILDMTNPWATHAPVRLLCQSDSVCLVFLLILCFGGSHFNWGGLRKSKTTNQQTEKLPKYQYIINIIGVAV